MEFIQTILIICIPTCKLVGVIRRFVSFLDLLAPAVAWHHEAFLASKRAKSRQNESGYCTRKRSYQNNTYEVSSHR